jgi:GntR family transcriptional regulator/MocR family aminotransferase
MLADLLPITVSRGEVTKRLYTAIRNKIGSGELRQNERMPSQRDLARQLKVSRGVVVTVYEQLIADDLLGTSRGAGTFVKRRRKQPETRKPAPSSDRFHLFQSVWRFEKDRDRNLLAPGHYHPDLFPTKQWQSAQQACRRIELSSPELQEIDCWFIRSFISRQLRCNNSIHCDPENILLTQGTWPSISLIASTLANPGETCLVEDPIHPLSCAALRFAGLAVKDFSDDLTIESAIAGASRPPRLLLTSSAIHFPLGVPVSEDRKRKLLNWANECGAIIVEDDYEGAFGIYGENKRTYFSLNEKSTSVYMGSIGKLFSYRCRLGFIVAPIDLIEKLKLVQEFMGMMPSSSAISVLAELVRKGHLDEHLLNLRQNVVKRKQLLLDGWSNNSNGLPALSAAGIHLSLPSAGNTRNGNSSDGAGSYSFLGARKLSEYSIREHDEDRFVVGMSNITESNVDFVIKTLSKLYTYC